MSERPAALATGASSGSGAELARVLAERGFSLGLVTRRADRLQTVLDDCREYSPNAANVGLASRRSGGSRPSHPGRRGCLRCGRRARE
jgi:short-subunit dehydrogenase